MFHYSFYHNDLHIKSYKRLYSHLLGENKSGLGGNGLNFRELREYNTSDDIRHLNWKVTARTNNPCVNLFDEDKKLNITLVYLVSGGIYFGSIRSKKEVMDEIFANLYFAGLGKKDRVSSVVFSEYEEAGTSPSQNKSSMMRALQNISKLEVLGKNVDFNTLEQHLLHKIKPKSLLFLIGDFLELPNLKFLSAKHELYCIVVRDKYEEDIEFLDDCNLLELNGERSKKFYYNTTTIQNYKKLMVEHDALLFDYFKKYQIKSKKIYTHQDPIVELSSFLRDM
ncbi:MAG: DUF58 domain-containing protein [Arcobacteraceae bacterium]|jgi:uncharacterized protein (DUF58 family)|nr:DUF58 domain-containing protein [Arcobacteraceae bacterium]